MSSSLALSQYILSINYKEFQGGEERGKKARNNHQDYSDKQRRMGRGEVGLTDLILSLMESKIMNKNDNGQKYESKTNYF